MNQFYIFPFNYKRKNERGEEVGLTATVVFCENDSNIVSNLQAELRVYYESHGQTDEMFVFGAEHLGKSLVKTFEDQIVDTYRHIPESNLNHLIDNTFVFLFDENRGLTCILGNCLSEKDIFSGMFNEGLLNIFMNRGGLIESNDGHHYVFL